MNFDAYPAQSAALSRLAGAAGSARTWGDGYGYVLVATGRAHIIIGPLVHVWDCAALLPIIEEAAAGLLTGRAGGQFAEVTL